MTVKNNAVPESSSDAERRRQYYYIDRCKGILAEKEKDAGRKLTCHVETFGCQMNARDSEKLRGILEEIGYENIESEEADLVLYNTCTVRENANVRVYGRLGRLNHYKKGNPEMIIGLCGCMMQEAHVVEKLTQSFRFVNLIFGTHNIYRLAELLYQVFTQKGMIVDIWQESDVTVEELPVDRMYAFKSGVNITYGCDNFCSYCIVPYVRGRERSRRPEEIICEIGHLAEDGVKEIMLLGQNVNSYGKGLDEPVTFAELLSKACRVPGIERVRFMTSHPKDLSDELIKVMASEPKVCPHLHLPLQSGSTRILEKMNRRYTKEDYLELVRKIREKCPDISLTTDIIVGFPGETEEDFAETLDVVERVGFDSAFTFLYSKRSGTPAAKMENQVDEKTAKERFDRLLALVQEKAKKSCARFEGQTLPVLVEMKNSQDESLVTGRLANNITVHFPGDESLIGQIVNVRLLKCHGFYYLGEPA